MNGDFAPSAPPLPGSEAPEAELDAQPALQPSMSYIDTYLAAAAASALAQPQPDTSSDAAIARAVWAADAEAGARAHRARRPAACCAAASSCLSNMLPARRSQRRRPLPAAAAAAGARPPPNTSLDHDLALQLHSDEQDRLCEWAAGTSQPVALAACKDLPSAVAAAALAAHAAAAVGCRERPVVLNSNYVRYAASCT